MTKIIDLRPDKHLMNTNFEKYQFCSEIVPVKCEKKLDEEILPLELNTSQDSWLEAKLFAFHNHLFKNPYDSTCWFIDKEGGIWTFNTNGLVSLVCTSKSIGMKSHNYTYNPSIAFATEKLIIVCNGGGAIELLVENNGKINSYLINNIESAVILDAKFIKETSKIIIALYRVDEIEGRKCSKLIFLFYNYNNNSENEFEIIELIRKQTLKVKGAVENVYIEQNGNFFNIISQNQVEFEFDSINSIQIKDNDLPNNSQIKIPRYYWSQDDEGLTVYIKIPEQYTEFKTKIEVTPTSISITVGNFVLLSGYMSNRLDSELTTWKRKDNTLEIELFKCESGLMWSELIKGDTGGEYLPNETLAAEIHSRLSHLCSNSQELNYQSQPAIGFNSEQLEECDVSGAENILQRICFNTHSITHMAMLSSSNRILFAEKQSSGQVICLRYDHDGCVWIIKEYNNDNWNLEHIYSIPGFGYVEASKTNKKFCVSSFNGKFIAIIEHSRHVLLYEKPEINVKIGRQRILDFGIESSPILGATATDNYLIILTKDTLYQLEVYSDSIKL